VLCGDRWRGAAVGEHGCDSLAD
jgi:hypothetical protein